MPGRLAIGIDAGGTKVEGLLVDPASGEVLRRLRVETPAADAEASVEALVAVAGQLREDRVVAVGVGAAGLVDLEGVVRYSPNIAWRDTPVAERLRSATGLPVTVDNDANAAAWGEFAFGAGRGSSDMFLLTIGTGIGGGMILGGRLFRGAHGFGAEAGHVIVERDGPLCGCGNHGCLEAVASGKAIGRLGQEAVRAQPDSELARLADGRPEDVTGEVVTAAARTGDPVATSVLREVGTSLGLGIAGFVNLLDPDVVVIGGGAVLAGDLLLEPARRAAEGAILGHGRRPAVPIVPAAMGNDAGAVGAAHLAWLAATGPKAGSSAEPRA